MKKSIFTLAMVVSLTMAMFSTAFGRYEDIRVVPRDSETYAYGVVGIKLYLNSNNVWEKQLNPFGGTPTPGFDNPVWAAAEAMTQANTTLGSDGKTRYPAPWIYPADVTTAPAISYYVFGDVGVLDEIRNVLSGTGISVYYSDSGYPVMTETALGTSNTALVYSMVSGLVAYIPVENQSGQLILDDKWFKALIAVDSFKF
ncbi:MAG: hypothetical protein WAV73_03645 [Candidatus Moraniibacteriota bacterium]